MQKQLYKYFQSEVHKSFLNEVSVTFIDKTNGKILKKRKILDANIERNGTF